MIFENVKKNNWVFSADFGDIITSIENIGKGEVLNEDGDPMLDKPANGRFKQSFHGSKKFGETYEAAQKLLTLGYTNDKMKAMHGQFDNEFKAAQDVIKFSEEGYDFDVPSILSGEDETWFTRVKQGSAPSIHIVFNGTASYDTNARRFYMQSAVVTKLAEILDEEAHIKVSAVYTQKKQCTNLEKKDKPYMNIAHFVTMKDYDETLDLRRLGAVAHPAFFRRIMFGVFQNEDGCMYGQKTGTRYGLGVPGESSEVVWEEKEKEIFDCDHVIKLPSPMDYAYASIERAIALCKSKLREAEVLTKSKS